MNLVNGFSKKDNKKTKFIGLGMKSKMEYGQKIQNIKQIGLSRKREEKKKGREKKEKK